MPLFLPLRKVLLKAAQYILLKVAGKVLGKYLKKGNSDKPEKG